MSLVDKELNEPIESLTKEFKKSATNVKQNQSQ
jgi:hypothetical protein